MRPRHDSPLRRGRATRLAAPRPDAPRPGKPLSLFGRSRRRGGDDGCGEPCPVEPNRPLDLSGGAAAALEFGD